MIINLCFNFLVVIKIYKVVTMLQTMQVLNIPFDDEDFNKIQKIKDDSKLTWREFLLKVILDYKSEKEKEGKEE